MNLNRKMQYFYDCLASIRQNFEAWCQIRKYISVNLFASIVKSKLRPYFIDEGIGVVIRNDRICKVSYEDAGRIYDIVFPVKRGPSNISRIEDGNGNDVTEEVRRVMGVGNNFHGIATTPTMIGYETIIIVKMNGDIFRYENNDVIVC
jgi:hypothetical protein